MRAGYFTALAGLCAAVGAVPPAEPAARGLAARDVAPSPSPRPYKRAWEPEPWWEPSKPSPRPSQKHERRSEPRGPHPSPRALHQHQPSRRHVGPSKRADGPSPLPSKRALRYYKPSRRYAGPSRRDGLSPFPSKRWDWPEPSHQPSPRPSPSPSRGPRPSPTYSPRPTWTFSPRPSYSPKPSPRPSPSPTLTTWPAPPQWGDEPENPEEPEEPEQPDQPEQPEQPEEPEQPAEPVKKRGFEPEQLSFDRVSDMLCPYRLWACPIRGHTVSDKSRKYEFEANELLRNGFECVDLVSDLEGCGGCGAIDEVHDCTAIPHAKGVSCVRAQCAVNSCAHGYKVAASGDHCVRA